MKNQRTIATPQNKPRTADQMKEIDENVIKGLNLVVENVSRWVMLCNQAKEAAGDERPDRILCNIPNPPPNVVDAVQTVFERFWNVYQVRYLQGKCDPIVPDDLKKENLPWR